VTVAAPPERPEGAPAPAPQSIAPTRPAVVEACPLCGAQLDPRQDWCLSCGAAARTRLAATPNWKGPVATIAVVAVLALGVLAAALVKLAGGSGSSSVPVTTTVTTAPAASAPVTPTSATPGVPTTIAPGAATTPTTTPSTGASTPTVTAQPGNAGGIASPGTAPTVTAKKGINAIPGLRGLTPAERKKVEKLLKPGAKPNSGR
jgi:hypothetical protein